MVTNNHRLFSKIQKYGIPKFWSQWHFKNINEKRLVAHDTSVEDYVESLESKNRKKKTKRDGKFLEEFLGNENNDEREVHTI